MKKNFLFLFFYLLVQMKIFSTPSFLSEPIQLEGRMPDKVSVLTGSILCQPVRTSYGYIAPGEGNQIYSFAPEGHMLWQRTFHRRTGNCISVGNEDMIYLVTGRTNLNLLNPTGLILWTEKSDFPIEDSPLPGKDGRVFVRGKNNIACYGLHGKRRWQTATETQNLKLPLCTLNDGSLLAFLEEQKEGKTLALRISPFGESLEKIVFSALITSASSYEEGVFLSFNQGGGGLIRMLETNQDGTITKWTVSQNILSGPMLEAKNPAKGKITVLSGSKGTVTVLSEKDGKVLESFETGYNPLSVKWMEYTSQGLVICSSQHGSCYAPEGKIIWTSTFDRNKQWNYLYATDSGFLCFCSSNWVLDAYRMRFNVNKSSSFPKKKNSMYKQYTLEKELSPLGIVQTEYINTIHSYLENGDYGNEEKTFIKAIENEADKIYSTWKSENWQTDFTSVFFRDNLDYCEEVFDLLGSCDIYIGAKKIAALAKISEDPTLLLSLVKCAGSIAYDPDGVLLDSLDFILKKKASPMDLSLLESIADSTYQICRYMGRPAFFEKGRSMLSYLLNPQFNPKTKEKAVSTMDLLVKAKI